MLKVTRKNTEEVLNNFGKRVVGKAKSNAKKFSSSGKGERSIDYDLKVSPNSIEFTFEMEDYMEFQDRGVSGVLKKYPSPFSYKDKAPPPNKLDKWIVKKGLGGRDSEGRFQSRKSIQFLISRSIFFNGIKPKKFFTKPFEEAFKELPEDIVEAYGLDIDAFFESSFKNNL